MSLQPPSSYDFVPLPDRAPFAVSRRRTCRADLHHQHRILGAVPPRPEGAAVPRRAGDDPTRAARRRARHGELDMARVRPAGRDLARYRRVRQDGCRAVLHLQRHDHGGAPAHRRRGQGARLGARAAQLGAERPAHLLRPRSRAGARGHPPDARQISGGGRPPRQGVAVVGDPRHLAHAGVPQGIRPRRLLRLSQRRPALL